MFNHSLKVEVEAEAERHIFQQLCQQQLSLWATDGTNVLKGRKFGSLKLCIQTWCLSLPAYFIAFYFTASSPLSVFAFELETELNRNKSHMFESRSS